MKLFIHGDAKKATEECDCTDTMPVFSKRMHFLQMILNEEIFTSIKHLNKRHGTAEITQL